MATRKDRVNRLISLRVGGYMREYTAPNLVVSRMQSTLVMWLAQFTGRMMSDAFAAGRRAEMGDRGYGPAAPGFQQWWEVDNSGPNPQDEGDAGVERAP